MAIPRAYDQSVKSNEEKDNFILSKQSDYYAGIDQIRDHIDTPNKFSNYVNDLSQQDSFIQLKEPMKNPKGLFFSERQSLNWLCLLLISLFIIRALWISFYLKEPFHFPSFFSYKPKISFGRKAFAVDRKNVNSQTDTSKNGVPKQKTAESNGYNQKGQQAEDIVFDPLNLSSPGEVELLSKIAKEQKKIGQERSKIKAKELQMKVFKTEISRKVTELKALKKSIEESLMLADKQQKLKLEKFIKIIEGMKTKNAAQIFEKLDLTILKELVPQMNPRKISGILDQMSPSKAKEVLITTVSEKNPYSGFLK